MLSDEGHAYFYFVSFVYRFADEGTQKFGSLEIQLQYPVTDWRDVMVLQGKARDVLTEQVEGITEVKDLIVLNYALLRFAQPRPRKVSSSRSRRSSRRARRSEEVPQPLAG